MSDEAAFKRLIDISDDPTEVSKQLLFDLYNMVDGIREAMREGKAGVMQQQQLVQAVKLIRTLTTEVDNDSSNTNTINN
ncbi:MAG: hypothetical protein GY954_16480, partial [Alteromonas sp.]|nr:hypothetical protein [Alteromonas sp.]